MILNKKLNKQFKTILSSSESALAILKEEAEKIDERYKKLAELEKAEIAEQIKSLTSQVEMCKSFLSPAETAEPEPECPVPTEETEEPSAPAASLFPDKPVVEEAIPGTVLNEEGEVVAVEEPEDEGPEFDGAGFTDADNYAVPEGFVAEGDSSAETEEEPTDSEESEWPSDFPDDWND